MDSTELPDFLRFNKYGSVLTPEERRRIADLRGVCITCGRVTHKVTAFRRKPLDSANVCNGICLICNPVQAKEWKKSQSVSDLNDSSGKKNKSKRQLLKKVIDRTTSALMETRHRSVPDISSQNRIPSIADISQSDGDTRSSNYSVDDSREEDAWDILRSMRTNPQDVQLLTQKCHELGNLQSVSCGSMYEIIDVMNRFPAELELQRAGILALWSFIVEGGDDLKMEGMDANILEVVVSSMEIGDEDLICWCLGMLSCLAEGLGVRARLLEEDTVQVVEKILEQSLEVDTYNAELIYWTMRCLVSLLTRSKEHEDYIKAGNFEIDCELLEDLEAIDDIKEVFLKGNAVHNVLLATQETDQMDTMTLMMGIEFLACLFSGHTVVKVDEKEASLFARICQKAVTSNRHLLFPSMKNIACACFCLVANCGSVDNVREFMKQDGWIDGFVNAAVDVLRIKRPKDEVVRDVMLCTLSHIFYCQQSIIDIPQSNSILKACVAMMTKEKTNEFIQETCLWILWGILSVVHNPSKSVVQDVIDLVHDKLAVEEKPHIVTLGTAILSDIAVWYNTLDMETALRVVDVQSEFIGNEVIVAEANKFFINVCKWKEMASCIESKVAKKASIELQYELSVKTGIINITVDELTDGIKTWQEYGRDIHSAARILYLIYKRSKCIDDAQEFIDTAVAFITDILENTTNEGLHNYACAALCSVADTSKILDADEIINAILRSQHSGFHQINAVWAMTTLDADISRSLLDDLALFLVNSISEHNSNQDILSASIAVLSIVLAKSRPILHANRTTFERAIGAVIRVMYECLDNGNNPQIFLFGLRCLKICSSDPFLHDCIFKEGGIVAIIDGMNINHGNVPIQEEGCSIIQRLARGSIDTAMLIIEADGVDVVLSILESYSTNAPLVSKAFDILQSLSISRQLRVFIASQGGLVLVTNAMNFLEGDSKVQEKALKALANLVSDIDNNAIEMSNLPAAVSSAVFNHLSEGDIQEVGITILKNLSKRSDSIRENLLTSGCCETVVTAMTIHMVCTFNIELHETW